MDNFLRKLKKFVLENNLISAKDKVVVGFSGGPDSMALIHSLWKISFELNFHIIAAHVNYHLRGQDSNEEEKFVRNICMDLNIPILVKQAKMETNSGIENKAREIRFKFFYKIVSLYKANSIALGHNAQDQAETILMNLFRGSGTNGLKGILPKNGNIIHPLIEFTREEIIAYLKHNNLSWKEDKSNYQNYYTRNKIRNVFIPFIKENINPKFTEKIINTARVLRESETVLYNNANKTLQKLILERYEDKIIVSQKKLLQRLPVMRFYYYKKIFKEITGSDRDFFQYHYEEIEKLLRSEGSKLKDFPQNITVIKEYDHITFIKTSSIKKFDTTNFRKIDKIRARIKFEDTRLYFKKLKKINKELIRDKNTVILDLDKIKFPLIFRHRKPGDKFVPLGMKHIKKVKEFLIDEKVSKYERDKLIIVQDAEKIIWIAGLRIDQRVAYNKDTVNFLVIRTEKIKYPKKRMAERFKRLLY